MIAMVRLIVAAAIGLVLGLVIGAGTVGVIVANYLPEGRLDCSVNQDGKVTDCTDANGKHVKVPHDVHIR
jgi:hypothetical protein